MAPVRGERNDKKRRSLEKGHLYAALCISTDVSRMRVWETMGKEVCSLAHLEI